MPGSTGTLDNMLSRRQHGLELVSVWRRKSILSSRRGADTPHLQPEWSFVFYFGNNARRQNECGAPAHSHLNALSVVRVAIRGSSRPMMRQGKRRRDLTAPASVPVLVRQGGHECCTPRAPLAVGSPLQSDLECAVPLTSLFVKALHACRSYLLSLRYVQCSA